MGHRANFVVVEPDGGWSLRYSHWAASTLPVDLLPGPEHALRLARAQQPVEEWLDARWGEGGLLLDPDHRLALFFCSHFRDLALRQAVFAVLARTWPGWQVRWAHGGMPELRAHLGLSSGRAPVAPPAEIFAEGGEWAFDSLVNVRSGGRTLAYSVDPEDDALAWLGPGLPDLLPAEALAQQGEHLPGSGLHLDLDARELGLWTTGTLPGPLAELGERWPGWRVEFWGDDLREQLRRAGDAVRLPAVDLGAGVASLARWFRQHLDHDPVADFRSGVAALARDGREVVAGAQTAAHVLVPPEAAAVAAVLAELRPGG